MESHVYVRHIIQLYIELGPEYLNTTASYTLSYISLGFWYSGSISALGSSLHLLLKSPTFATYHNMGLILSSYMFGTLWFPYMLRLSTPHTVNILLESSSWHVEQLHTRDCVLVFVSILSHNSIQTLVHECFWFRSLLPTRSCVRFFIFDSATSYKKRHTRKCEWVLIKTKRFCSFWLWIDRLFSSSWPPAYLFFKALGVAHRVSWRGTHTRSTISLWWS